MESSASARIAQDRGDPFIVLDQQVAGGRAHEHLDACRPRQPFEFADIAGIVARAADPEGEVAMHAAGGAPHLVGERCLAGSERIGVGHFEDGGDTAEHRRARTGLQIFLVLQAGLAEMHLAVDDTGQDVQAAAIDRLTGRSLAEIADSGDAPCPHADIAPALAVMVHHSAACQDEVEGGCHGASNLLRGECGRLT